MYGSRHHSAQRLNKDEGICRNRHCTLARSWPEFGGYLEKGCITTCSQQVSRLLLSFILSNQMLCSTDLQNFAKLLPFESRRISFTIMSARTLHFNRCGRWLDLDESLSHTYRIPQICRQQITNYSGACLKSSLKTQKCRKNAYKRFIESKDAQFSTWESTISYYIGEMCRR